MQKSLVKNQTVIPYTVRSDRRVRRVRISVAHDGKVVVTKPRFASFARIEGFIEEKFDWIQDVVARFEKKPKKLLARYSAKDFQENKQRAFELVKERTAHLNQFYGYEIKNISIKNQKTRWGSCSGKKNLSFNYKILFLPLELQDYLIVHELCHLKEMNHSKDFWNLVAEQIPDHKSFRKKMKLY